MAGSSMTFAYDEGEDRSGLNRRPRRVTVSWTSDDTTGAVSGTTGKIVGEIIRAVTVPGAGGAAPSDNYDIVITDDSTINILVSCTDDLVDRDTANVEEVYFLIGSQAMTPISTARVPVVCSALTVAVTNAGNSKTGTLYLYLS